MIESRVEKHLIKKNHPYYSMLDNFCFVSKNLYNHANYIVRNEFCKSGQWIKYGALDKLLKNDIEYPDYRAMPTAQSAQQTLRLLDKNWKSFFASIKDWSKNKDKYLGRPKLPKYKSKNGRNILILTNQEVKLKPDNLIHFPKSFNGLIIKPQFVDRDNFVSFQQIRFIPHKNHIVVELVYNIEIPDTCLDGDRYIAIDIGVNNLATVCNNFYAQSFIINGKPVKSMNQYYNKEISHYSELAKRMNDMDFTKRMDSITNKRNRKIDDYMHKASRLIINYCIKNKVSKVVIGNNKGWKQNSEMSKRVNQHFTQIPHMRFIEMIQYKAKEYGIEVILTEESYTSGTSFIDDEEPIKKNYNKDRRVYRGLFVSNDGIQINADLNGAYQIMKKVFPIKWNRGCVLHPVVVNAI